MKIITITIQNTILQSTTCVLISRNLQINIINKQVNLILLILFSSEI